MATKDGNTLTGTTDSFAASTWIIDAPGNFLPIGRNSTQFEMQAADSISGVVYTWVRTSPDFAGLGYPGPNSPVEVSIKQLNRVDPT